MDCNMGNVEHESDGDCKFSSTHSQVDIMGKTGNIHNICTKGFIFVIKFSEQRKPNVSKIYMCCFSSIELVNSVPVTRSFRAGLVFPGLACSPIVDTAILKINMLTVNRTVHVSTINNRPNQ